jgi:uncharacterized membrane protein YkvA (DUF1232 family)/AraC-like DNA-binding protein
MPLLHPLAAAHMYDLIAMALGATHNGAAVANCRDIRVARLKAIKADILENIGDELTVTAVALRQGITPRYMHMLFEIEGVTFSEYVLGQRLMRAYGMISDPRFAGLNITTVAFASGFGDLSYFNRTFRRRFGTTPSELRKTVYQDERTSRPLGRRLPTRRGEGYFGSDVPARHRFGPLKAQKRTAANSRPSSFGESFSVLTSICWVMKRAAFGQEISLHRFQECQRTVRRDFWAKLRRFARQVPFVEDLVAAYYCAMDTASPMRVRSMLLAALAYFIVPFDLIPDITPALGLTDDSALLVAVIGRVSSHITPVHRATAARAFGKQLPPTG